VRIKIEAEMVEFRQKIEAEKAELLYKVDTARRLLAMGLSIEDVAMGVDLDYDVVCRL